MHDPDETGIMFTEHDLLPVNLKLSQNLFFYCIASLDGFFTKSVTGVFLLLTTGGLISVICCFDIFVSLKYI